MAIKNKYNRICNVCTAYSLFLYLLISSISEIKETFFVFNSSGIPKSLRVRFKNSFSVPDYNQYGILGKTLIKIGGFIYFRLIKYLYIPMNKNTKIFGNDFSRYDPVFIGCKTYSLIEDCPHSFQQTYMNYFKKFDELEHRKKLLYPIAKFLNGPTYYNRFGNNKLCTNVIMTYDDKLEYLKDKSVQLLNTSVLWQESTIEKQQMILDFYDISDADIVDMRSRETILFTQPLYPDFIRIDEHREIYRKLISRYKIEDLVIKTHPRDIYEYEKDFPNLHVIRSVMPSQLLDLLNIRYEKAVTVFSSAVKQISYPISIDWCGIEVSETLQKYIQPIEPPNGANIIQLNINNYSNTAF